LQHILSQEDKEMKKNNLRSYWGILAQIPLALVVLLMLAVSACEPEADTGNASNLPTELQNTKWIHRDGDRVEFGTNTVKVIPVSGTGKTFTLQDSATVSALSMTTLYFGSSKTADFIVYLNGTIDSVGLGGVEKTGFWQQDTGNGYEKPVDMLKSIQLTETNWKAILIEIETVGKDVNLDLSGCTQSSEDTGGGLNSDGAFDPLPDFNTGKDRIVSLILPNATTYISGSFDAFSRLTSVSFPASIGLTVNPFRFSPIASFILTGTGYLSTIEDGKALVVDNQLIAYPSASGNITLNNITYINMFAFYNCTSLTSVSFPDVTNINNYAFQYCTSLSSISFPAVERIASSAFSGCTILTDVSFPVVYEISFYAFSNCTSLTSVSLPAVYYIGPDAFQFTGTTALTITLGPNAPNVGFFSFRDVNPTKIVTVKVPAGATGYGPIPATYSGDDTSENWGNGFRGGGWNGRSFVYHEEYGGGVPSINTNITLQVQYQE
jgi:hypothetical protein